MTEEAAGRGTEGGRDHLSAFGLVAAFLVLLLATAALSRWHHARQERLAAEWFSRGEAALAAGNASAAVAAFESGLVYARGDRRRELRLADALLAAGRDDQGRSHLLTLWDRQPGSGPINAALARVAARAGRADEAVRYYDFAIHGLWEGVEPAAARRQLRLELARLHLANGQQAAAEAQLTALRADLPRTKDAHVEVGRLLLRADSPRRALESFRTALSLAPDDPAALAGAGEAAFRLGEYLTARSNLRRAVAAGADDDAARLLEDAEQIVALDPFRPRLGRAERARRALAARDAALARLAACEPGPDGAAAIERHRTALRLLDGRLRAAGTEAVEAAMDVVFRAEDAAERACGPADKAADRALLVLAQRQAGSAS